MRGPALPRLRIAALPRDEMSPEHLEWGKFVPEVAKGTWRLWVELVKWVAALFALMGGLALIVWGMRHD